MLKRTIALVMMCVLALGVTLNAQKKSGKKKAATKAAGKKKAATKGASKKATGTPSERYAKQLTEWKDLLKSLRKLRLQYLEAKDAERVALAQKYNEGLAAGNAMIPKLKSAAQAAYVAAPNEDRELRNLLIKIAKDDLDRGYYANSASLAEVLIKNKCQDDKIFNIAGTALFSIHNFVDAEKYLKRAAETNALKPPGTNFLAEIPAYKKLWKDEQEIRKKEEAARKDPKTKLPQVLLKTTRGDIVIELFENEAPDTVGNFISLVEKGFYKGLTFHRVLRNFMAQGGCPLGTGTGGPGYNIKCECLDQKKKYRNHFRGSVSMAKGTPPHTGGSQFFLCFLPTPQLNGKHTVFGRIIKGLDVLPKITLRNPTDKDPPEPDKIVSATVLFKRNHEYKPNKSLAK